MNAEGYLCLGAIELGNQLRTLTYLRRGLAGGRFGIRARSPLVTERNCRDSITGDVYESTYHSLYGGSVVTTCDPVDALDAENLGCYCAAYDNGPYIDPATDDAPWYTPDRPESAAFLGFVPWNVSLQPSLKRSVGERSLGSSLGPARAGGYLVAVAGTLYATSRAGMAYGERWLTSVLAGELCAGQLDLTVLPACPDEGGAARWRTLTTVGLVDGPVFDTIQDVPACIMQPVNFQLASESPFLLADPVVAADHESLLGARSYLLEADEWVGDVGVRITVDVGPAGPVKGLHLVMRPAPGGACPSPYPPCWEVRAPSIPASGRLVIDGVERSVVMTNPATGEILALLDALKYQAPFRWPVVAPCSMACLTVEAGAAPALTTLTVEAVGREL